MAVGTGYVPGEPVSSSPPVTASQAWAEGAPVEPPALEDLEEPRPEIDPEAPRGAYPPAVASPAAAREPSRKFKGWESDASAKSTLSAKVWREYSGQDLHKKLFAAACTNNLMAIAKLSSKEGVDVNAGMEKGQRVLFGAAFYGHLDAVKALLNLRADVRAVDETGSTALHYACMASKNAEIVETLLGAGALPDETNAEGSTPLLLAVAHDTEQARDCVTKLLEAGADANGPDGRTQTVLHYVIRMRDDPDMVYTLLEVGNAEPNIYDNAGNLAIHVAVDLNRVEAIKRMVAAELSLSKSNVSGTSSFTRSTRAGLTVLHIAALHGNALLAEFLAALLSDQPAVLDRATANGDTAMHIAAAEGHAGCVEALISAGADPNAVNNKGLTALHMAMAKQHFEVVEEFLSAESGAGPALDLELRLPTTQASYLHFLAQTGMEELISEFVSHGAPITDVDAHRRTALHAMAHCGSDKGCRAFVELGLSPAAEDKDGKLPMHYAAMGGQADALQYLLQTGANMQPHPVTLDSRTHKGRDVLFIAALAGQAEIVAMLLDLDMGDMKDMVDRDGRSALHAAAMGGDPDCASLLMDAGWPVDATDFKDYTPLFVAAECGNTLVLKLLVDAGASVLLRSKASESALHVAAKKDNAEAVIALVEAGHQVDALDHRKRTPCHEAAYHGSVMAGIALVRLGADIEATEQYGLTPIAAAVSAGHRPMAKTLEDEACRSADFNHRENIDLAYRIAGPAPIQDLPDDVDEVPPMVGSQPPSRDVSGRPARGSLKDENSELMRAMSPLSGARRRRSSTAQSNGEPDEFSRPASRASVLAQGMPSHGIGEDPSESSVGAGVTSNGKKKGGKKSGDHTGGKLGSDDDDDETDEEDMDPAIRHVLRKMEANLAGKDLDDDALSLGSSLGSDYHFEDLSKAAVEALKSVSGAE